MTITVESSIQLSDDQKKKLEEKLTKSAAETKLNVEYVIDPGLIGGLRITSPTQVHDFSLAVKLAQLNDKLASAL